MTNNSFTGYICWQKQPISTVINKEAVSIERPLFLATHAPFSSITYLKSPRQMTDTSEEELLAELRQRGADNQHTFMVLQGIPGTGKSHLIRWLKERFASGQREGAEEEIVLLIERANSSLRQTLMQIIGSGLFNTARFADQLRKLEGATEQLSDAGLADTILNNLQVATLEVKAELPKRIKRRRLERFLLDYLIREELKKAGGPIERIMRFLSGRDRDMLNENEFPSFGPQDFELSVDVRRQIKREGYREASQLADKLANNAKNREELAAYLNQLLPFAVQRTTALSANDLKQMFNDLRRELKQQGKQLALFIEDIAVFTGLDAGLIDVLITQHTGESNREFCRLTSVVGITDHYYLDSFPDNIKQRVTHHLTLNTERGQARQASHLLTSPAAVADLVARYLNVMRLPPADVEAWAQMGGIPSDLPNACLACPHRSACHDAFGAVPLDGDYDNDALQVGLYPFNQTALLSMYDGLDTAKVSQTPRTLLNSVIEYVLLSHTPKVKDGQFPPRASELGSDFEPPTLAKPAQLRLMTSQSPSSSIADRIQSLILFWGDRTLDQTTSPDGQRQVGGLKEGVFKAFELPFIEGEASLSQTKESPQRQEAKKPAEEKQEKKKPEEEKQEEKKPEKQPAAPPNPLLEEIERWRTGEQLLKNYTTYAKWLAKFAEESIDWEAHHVSSSLVRERIRQRRFVIEGQSGRATGDYLLFERSDELAYVLHALTELQQDAQGLAPEKIGIHLYTLSNWLRKEEARIVEFVRQPSSQIESPRPLDELLLQNCLLIACLSEELVASETSSRQLYLRLVKDEKKQKAAWDAAKTQAKQTRTRAWSSLMRRCDKNAQSCQRELLVAVNRPQGTSKQVIYVDAARLLNLIREFKKEGWTLPPLSLSEVIDSKNKTWVTAAKTYQELQQNFGPALAAEQEQIQAMDKRLKELMGEESPKDVFTAISDLLTNFRQHQISYRFEENSALTARKLSNRLSSLASVLSSEGIALALSLSGAGTLIQESKAYRDYFEQFLKLAQKEQDKLDERIGKLEAEIAGNTLIGAVETQYQEMEQLLASITDEGGDAR